VIHLGSTFTVNNNSWGVLSSPVLDMQVKREKSVIGKDKVSNRHINEKVSSIALH